jgi:hypothetical protein
MSFARQAAQAEFRDAPSRRKFQRAAEVCEDSRPCFEGGKYLGHAPIHATATQRHIARRLAEAAKQAREEARAVREEAHGRKAIRRQRAA